MAKARLTTSQKRQWAAEFGLAQKFDQVRMQPTRIYAEAMKRNEVHWQDLMPAIPIAGGNMGGWKYDAITANYLYANQQSVLPRVLMRAPKVIVKPAQRMTAAYKRIADETSPVDRWVAAVVCQQVANWRWREFNLTKQVRRCVKDDYSRGIAAIRHGFMYEGDKTLSREGKTIEHETHTHLREGWPFAVHQPLDYYRWDQKARETDAREWVAFGKLWRPEDLKQRLNLRREVPVNTYIGKDLAATDQSWQNQLAGYGDSLGYTLCWEIWDRREGKVIYWLDEQNEDLKVTDWPLDISGLPDSVLCSNESNERIEPVSEASIIWTLQQELNKLISLVLVYAKRGVPIIGANKGMVDEVDADAIARAEVYETIMLKGDVREALGVVNANVVPQTLMLAIQEIKTAIREVGSISNFDRGTRENVASATEAAEIGAGGDMRQSMRAEAIREFCATVTRKDWQILQQATTEDQMVDVAVEYPLVYPVRATAQQIKMEFDFSIEVGSTEPPNEQREQVQALAFVKAMQADQQVYRQVNPRFLGKLLCRAFGFDENEVLASIGAANQQIFADKLMEAFGNGAGGAMAQSNVPGYGEAQSDMAAKSDNDDAGATIQ